MRSSRWYALAAPVLALLVALAVVPVVSAAATIIATISFAPSRAGVVVANPTTLKVYAAHEDGPTSIKVINGNTHAILATIPTLGFHTGMSVNPVTNRIYVSQQFSSQVLVIDGATDTAITQIPIPGGPIAYNVVNPALNRLYVLRPNSGDIAVVDTGSNSVIGTIPAGCCDSQAALALDAVSHRLYVANSTSNRVVVIDGANPAHPTIASIPMPSGAFRVALHTGTRRVYVTHQGLSTVSVIDGLPGSPTENTIIGTINVGPGPFGLAVDSANNRAYVARPAVQSLEVVDTTMNMVVDTVASVGNGTASLAVLPSLRRIYATDDGCKCVTVIEDAAPPPPGSTNIPPAADTYVRNGADNTNEGASTFMRVRASGNNRALVRFDQAAIQAAVNGGALVSATLRLTLTENAENWGTGRTVDAHRIIVPWNEGNGWTDGNSPPNRGTGAGASWACASDANIANQAKDCSGATEWEMGQPNQPQLHPWIATPTATVTITNSTSGVVEWDVTADVAAFLSGSAPNHGWLIRKTLEGQNGLVHFGTKESGSPPVLVIVRQ